MQDIKSTLAGGTHSLASLTETEYPRFLQEFPLKAYWFASKGYVPHVYQATFHAAKNGVGHLARYRHLVAGRRGGKTTSAAWEVLYYCLFPNAFHQDRGRADIEFDRGLMVWLLAKDYPTGKPSIDTFLAVIREAGLAKGKDFIYNKTERRFEFMASGSVVQFRTADDPQSLRGYGLDILWMDEAAFVTTREAYDVTAPSLGDHEGIVITTTTPYGKNWLWEEFFTGKALLDLDEFRVQYTSIDNPYYPASEWRRNKARMHPAMFKQEHMASFDAMEGLSLSGTWLRFWVSGDAEPKSDEISMKHLLDPETGQYRLRVHIGVDPAISQSEAADQFALAVVGVTDDNAQAFLLDYFLGKVPFPDQLDLIQEWALKWRPETIGVEANAFQVALVQQGSRLDSMPGLVPVFSRGKKNDRILALAPVFKQGKVRINARHGEFIDQWIAFDAKRKNQRDDLLDAVEIAVSAAGVLLAYMPHESLLDGEPGHTDGADIAGAVREQLRIQMMGGDDFDEHMGNDW